MVFFNFFSIKIIIKIRKQFFKYVKNKYKYIYIYMEK